MARATGDQTSAISADQGLLNKNALGLWGLVIMGIAYMGLALTAYFNFGIMQGITGPIVPLAFAAVTVGALYLYRRCTIRSAYLLSTAPLVAFTVLAAESISRLFPAWM